MDYRRRNNFQATARIIYDEKNYPEALELENLEGGRGFFLLLSPIVEEELLELRLKGDCCLVWKEGDNLFYTKLPSKSMRVTPEMFGKSCVHICTYPRICGKFLPKDPLKVGGICPKTLTPTLRTLVPTLSKIRKSKRIEKFKFIKRGYEIFGSSSLNVIIVFECDNYIKPEPLPDKWQEQIVALSDAEVED